MKAIALLVLASGSACFASSSANYSLAPSVFGGGGGISQSGNYSAFSAAAGFVVGTATSASYTAHYGFLPSAGPMDVTGRLVFYNQSSWDGNNAAANATDDAANATDKTALRPGGTATFANYTSFSRGLNGIMVDLPLGGTPTAADFTFKRGNNNTPAGWVAAPAPSSVTVRPGAGLGGADRVTLIWPNNTLQKQWLEVTVLSTANTGLADPDVFYFGNTIGEAGNSPANALVTSLDLTQTRNAISALGVPVTSRFDYNRDGRVTSLDHTLCRNNISAIGLQLITVPPLPAMPGALGLEPSAELAVDENENAAFAAEPGDQPGRHGVRWTAGPTADRPSRIAGLRITGLFAQERGTLRIKFVGRPGAIYRVQATAALGTGWTPLPLRPEPADASGAFELELPEGLLASGRFYRVVEE